MIVTQLLGGLGNQLFQYAMGRALAEKHGVPLRLDTSAFENYRLRSYALSRFNINATGLSTEEHRTLRLPREGEPRIVRWMRRAFGSRMTVVRERGFGFDASALESPSNTYLQGYWQSPKYFAAIESLIRSELTIREPATGRNREAAAEIEGTNSASVHVRRGDYAENPTTRDYHGLCGPDYYDAAQRMIRDRGGDVRFFVFSDDPAWARENLRFLSPATILDHNGPAQDYEDLRLMSLCRHHIVANSTFSWWGAWLCRNKEKFVIAPRNWFQAPGQNADDLIPASWYKL